MLRVFLHFLYILFLNNNFIICVNETDSTESVTTTVNITDQTVTIDIPKISGGYRGNSRKWGKYMASIRNLRKEMEQFGQGHFCGGAIISQTAILTASHCLFRYMRDKSKISANSFGLSVVVGTVNRLKITSTTQQLQVTSVILHPQYDPHTYYNDIALIIVNPRMTTDGENVAVISLPKERPKENLKCTAAGWGSIYYKGPRPDEIVYANLVVLSETVCHNHYPTKTKKELCANLPGDKYMDTCQGDSGGPLFCKDAIYGVVSRGFPCGLHFNKSGLYTNVYDYLGWIHAENAKSGATINAIHYNWLHFILFCMFL